MDAITPIVSSYLKEANSVSSASLNTAAATSPTPATSPSPTAPSDSVQFSPAAIELAKYAGLARQIADNVRPERIAALKELVSTGDYPAPLMIEGFLALAGSSLSTGPNSV